MASRLTVSIGQCSRKGRKSVNQDFYGACRPHGPERETKGITVALADGIGSSDVSQVASQAAVAGFFEDYYATPEAWSVSNAAQRVIAATNSWLHAQTRRSQYRYDMDRGYVCTLSAMVLKGTFAHLFHVGDSRIYRLQGSTLEQLTEDHRLRVSREESYLARAMGGDERVEIDYQRLPIQPGDVFLLSTDGVHEFINKAAMARVVSDGGDDDLDALAQRIVDQAYEQGSDDNLTVQLVRVDAVPEQAQPAEAVQHLIGLPFPPHFNPPVTFEGYRIQRQLHGSARSHVYLAMDEGTGEQVALKILATETREEPAQLERFLMEEWIAQRINHVHVASARPPQRERHYLYTVMEFIEGRTLEQWMTDNPRPGLEAVRGVVEQIASGLQAFHRLEMIHRDLRPANVMIDHGGTVKLIDFGSTRVPGIMEIFPVAIDEGPLGTAAYSAPEYFLEGEGTMRSDIYSLAVVTYQMLTGQLPYGTEVAKARSRSALNRLRYQSVRNYNPELPVWLDGVLRKALHPDPEKRHEALSEFTFNLRHPSPDAYNQTPLPLMERDPVRFWQGMSLVLAGAVVTLLVLLFV
ncbi:bifunctional protein-serine/threonine kinase/phosphatase [Vreelandella utahensis]|uniref:bifunctional protein-serine/threonine kinase/phosphatase n=1 Tax=Vreelandella halophila TaxID=86177 RepID=UPI0009859FEE|nr:bifunctional protein-serine/threonine kinase/phosphatase [Halomonas utahensis]